MSIQTEDNRVLHRLGARELTQEELDSVSAAASGPCLMTFTHQPRGGSDEDVECPPQP
ncbi:MAG TPA: hypothetical protein VJW55_04400 [Candidatus Angelobacter sp.]|jgi:hypothetical protein|nr:hypothetical protein [Candidatus Angelobacter sp.]